jgi:predicted transcriptional regulator of viral defense system
MFSSPERTVLDILYFESVCGGFRNVSLVVRDLMPILNTADLKKAIDKYPFSSSIQRLGYMLEYFDADKRILNILIKWAKENRLPVIALSSRLPKKGGFHPMWRVIENAKIEGEE